MEKHIACIFEDVGGYYVCADGIGYLDARGHASSTKAEAMRRAYETGYTHARGSGTYRPSRITRITSMIETGNLDTGHANIWPTIVAALNA